MIGSSALVCFIITQASTHSLNSCFIIRFNTLSVLNSVTSWTHKHSAATQENQILIFLLQIKAYTEVTEKGSQCSIGHEILPDHHSQNISTISSPSSPCNQVELFSSTLLGGLYKEFFCRAKRVVIELTQGSFALPVHHRTLFWS